jgi:hypothetical protein
VLDDKVPVFVLSLQLWANRVMPNQPTLVSVTATSGAAGTIDAVTTCPKTPVAATDMAMPIRVTKIAASCFPENFCDRRYRTRVLGICHGL